MLNNEVLQAEAGSRLGHELPKSRSATVSVLRPVAATSKCSVFVECTTLRGMILGVFSSVLDLGNPLAAPVRRWRGRSAATAAGREAGGGDRRQHARHKKTQKNTQGRACFKFAILYHLSSILHPLGERFRQWLVQISTPTSILQPPSSILVHLLPPFAAFCRLF